MVFLSDLCLFWELSLKRIFDKENREIDNQD